MNFSFRPKLGITPAAINASRERAPVSNTPDTTTMSDEDLKGELERLKAENEQLKSQRGRSVSLRVSEKGGVSVYGLGRFPVTCGYRQLRSRGID